MERRDRSEDVGPDVLTIGRAEPTAEQRLVRRRRWRTGLILVGISLVTVVGYLLFSSLRAGADSPPAAGERLIDAVHRGSLSRLARTVSPYEVGAARRLATGVDTSMGELGLVDPAVGWSADLQSLDVSVTTAQMQVETVSDDVVVLHFSDNRLTVDSASKRAVGPLRRLLGVGGPAAPQRRGWDAGVPAAGATREFGLVTVRVDGRWYVSPVLTYLEGTRANPRGAARPSKAPDLVRDPGVDRPRAAGLRADTLVDRALARARTLDRDQALVVLGQAATVDPAGRLPIDQTTTVSYNTAGFVVESLVLDRPGRYRFEHPASEASPNRTELYAATPEGPKRLPVETCASEGDTPEVYLNSEVVAASRKTCELPAGEYRIVLWAPAAEAAPPGVARPPVAPTPVRVVRLP